MWCSSNVEIDGMTEHVVKTVKYFRNTRIFQLHGIKQLGDVNLLCHKKYGGTALLKHCKVTWTIGQCYFSSVKITGKVSINILMLKIIWKECSR